MANPPDIVFADANLDEAVPGAAWGILRLSGQVCCGGSRLFVEEKIHDQFVSRIAEFASKVRVGNGLDPDTEMGPLVSREQYDRVSGYVESGQSEGASLVLGVSGLPEEKWIRLFFPAHGVRRCSHEMRIAQEEIFGPVISVIPFREIDEVVSLSNTTRYGLAGGVWTRDVSKAHRVAKALQAGVVWVNCYNVFDAPMPFGGYKMSGYGRESGLHALELYTQVKSVWIKVD